MQAFNNARFYSLRGDANALGGYLEEPFQKVIPPLAPASLPAVGGFATSRSEAFTFEEIVSCSSAYTRVSGQEHTDGSVSILVTAAIEGLNLLEVIEAERIVAQLSIEVPSDRGPFRISTAGSKFEGLRVAGQPKRPRLNARLQQQLECDETGSARGFTITEAADEGRKQAGAVIEGFRGSYGQQWAEKRFAWMTGTQPHTGNLCSLIDGFDGADCGHVVVIPGFGRFIFGELLVSPDSVELVSIRAELGCPVKGKITINTGGGGGVGDF